MANDTEGSPSPEDRLGRRIRYERDRRGWSQSELADRLAEFGISLHFTAIAKMEQRDVERPRAIRLDEAFALAQVFGVTVERLLEPPTDRIRVLYERAVRACSSAYRADDQLVVALGQLRRVVVESGDGLGLLGVIEAATDARDGTGTAWAALESELERLRSIILADPTESLEG